MTHDQLTAVLAGLPHFMALDTALIERIATGCRYRTYQKEESLFHEGDPCSSFFAVQSGSVRVYRLAPDGHERVIHHLRAGQTFAEVALLHYGVYPASAVALETPTEVLEIGREPFLQLFREDHRIAAAMLGSMCGWILRLVERVDELSVASAGARLARHLLRLPSSRSGDTLTIELPMSKKDLSAHLSITPETLSRLLRRWRDRGLVESSGRSVRVLDAGVLETIADETAVEA